MPTAKIFPTRQLPRAINQPDDFPELSEAPETGSPSPAQSLAD
jgi:hypothetical protein